MVSVKVQDGKITTSPAKDGNFSDWNVTLET
jgi:hypothetical protein